MLLSPYISPSPPLSPGPQVCSLCLFLHSVQFSSVAQSCPTLCNPMNCSTPGLPVHHHCCCQVASIVSDPVRPHRRQPTRLPRPWDSPGESTGVGCHFLLQCMRVESESEVAQSCPTLSAPWTAAHQAAPSLGSSRRERWSGAPSPSVVHHHCCPVNKVFSTIFLDSVYVH